MLSKFGRGFLAVIIFCMFRGFKIKPKAVLGCLLYPRNVWMAQRFNVKVTLSESWVSGLIKFLQSIVH